jgi:[ribosomal protein S5]-alanine N-acetyltransferase
MPALHLIPPTLDVADELLRFETDNRAFFEARINSRPPSYYSAEGVRAAIALAEREAAEDKGYQFLMRNGAGELVGRVNLIGVRRTHFQMADLGYRMAESACGKGYASEAVRLVLAKAFGELRLMRLEANARVGNEGSVKVLLRNGFREFGRSTRSFELGGVWHDRLHFERHAPV